MRELLMLLAGRCLFLLDVHRCRIVDSQIFDAFDNASLSLRAMTVEFTIAKERGQLLLILQPINRTSQHERYGIGLIRDLLSGGTEANAGAELDESNLTFLEDRFGDIIDLFTEEHIESTRSQLKSLRKQRAAARW